VKNCFRRKAETLTLYNHSAFFKDCRQIWHNGRTTVENGTARTPFQSFSVIFGPREKKIQHLSSTDEEGSRNLCICKDEWNFGCCEEKLFALF
jgi:hypothetical protein